MSFPSQSFGYSPGITSGATFGSDKKNSYNLFKRIRLCVLRLRQQITVALLSVISIQGLNTIAKVAFARF